MCGITSSIAACSACKHADLVSLPAAAGCVWQAVRAGLLLKGVTNSAAAAGTASHCCIASCQLAVCSSWWLCCCWGPLIRQSTLHLWASKLLHHTAALAGHKQHRVLVGGCTSSAARGTLLPAVGSWPRCDSGTSKQLCAVCRLLRSLAIGALPAALTSPRSRSLLAVHQSTWCRPTRVFARFAAFLQH